MPGKANNILQEHFWFTATTLAVNGFLMSANIECQNWYVLKVISTLISLYAVYLIVERSASAANKVKLPEDLKEPVEKMATDKARETWYRLKIVPKHFLFVACELSGAFFYLLLVVASCIGVWLTR
jgi:hypothetical protein